MSGTDVPSATRGEPDLERLAFERLVADLSARVANASHDSIVSVIEAGLARVLESLGYDRCTYTEFAPEGTLSVVCSAATGGIEPLSRGTCGPTLPWVVSELRAGRIVALAGLPDDLPRQAAADAEWFREIGLRSHLSIPLRVGGRVAGALSFGGLRNARSWPEDVITRLRIIGEIFASAIARARAEEETQLLRSRLWHADRVARTGALTAAIAHELNQPLTAILSNAQAGLTYLGQGQAKLAEIRAVLESIVRDDKRAAETIRTMRALLRQDESGRERIDLATALREVLQLLARELHRQEIHLEIELGAGWWVTADKVQIEQVALNLILNAAAAMQGQPTDSRILRLTVSRAAGDKVVVAVRDSGIGIAVEHLDAVFEPFWTTRRDGLGLGLAICRSIVQAHGGAISVEPNPDRGVTFRFELPLEVSDGASVGAGAPPEEATLKASTQGAVREPTVCVVDDDPVARRAGNG